MNKKIISTILAIIVIIAMFSFTAFPAMAVSDANNGDWNAKTATLKNTGEAELMVRVGDIDALNDEWAIENGYNPFTAINQRGHGYPWDLDPTDPEGTDRIYMGSHWKSNTMDGYSNESAGWKNGANEGKAFGEGALTITMNYDASGISVKNALLQLCIDDFQALVWKSNFTVTLNGKNAPFIAEILNQVEQSGPTSYIVSAVIPSGFFSEISSGKLVITIDETTGVGDGYAIDFAKLLVNYNENLFAGKFSGITEPGATVRLLGTSTTVTAANNGSFTFKAIPGLNAVRASKAGYVENYEFGIVLSSDTEWEPNVWLSQGVGKPDIDFSQFNVTDAWADASKRATETANKNITLNYTIRDFKQDYILFEGSIVSGEGLVKDTLGADRKPVYNLALWQEWYGSEVTQAMLNGLFNDVDGYNMRAEKTLLMEPDGNGYWTIDSSLNADGSYSPGFFPIDNELFGNEGNPHNYHFSVEIHTRFKYVQNATFEFIGDDDVWVFFNNKLVIDLGGVHSAASATVNLDEIAADLGIKVGDIINFDMFYMERHMDGSNMYIRTNFEFLNLDASKWATEELQRADELGLIPDILKGADLKKPINRAEFAAVVVKLYENLSGIKTTPASNNPFIDTNDTEILKAYNTNLMVGLSENEFVPNMLLNRETAATALTRVIKSVYIDGWTLATDSNYTLSFTQPNKFADDDKIQDWAKASVYFMVANDIITGMDGNMFNPRVTTPAEEALGYANATREQALIMSVRIIDKLKGKPLNYSSGDNKQTSVSLENDANNLIQSEN